MLTIIDAIFWGLAVIGAGYVAAAVVAVRRFGRVLTASAPSSPSRPPVTILKPLHGAEPELYNNLKSFLLQDYPSFQVVFGVRDPKDPAVAIVERLHREFPARDIALVINAKIHGANYKISNLANMMAAARHDVLVIADSDMRVDPGYLGIVVDALSRDGVGLVTCLYTGDSADGAWSELGAQHINHGFLVSALVGHALGGRSDTFGATMALRRATLEEIGGFKRFYDQLADDAALGAAVKETGRTVALAPVVVSNHVYEPSFGALFDHELRWGRTVRGLAPIAFASTIVTHPVVWSLAGVAFSGFEGWALVAFAAVLGLRLRLVRAVEEVFGLERAQRVLLPARDVLSFAILVLSFCGTRVKWRGHGFLLGSDGGLTPHTESEAHENLVSAPPVV